MFHCKKIAILILTLLFSVQVIAQEASQKLTMLLHQVKTFQADFVQTVKDKTLKTLQQSTGKIYLDRPGKFRWEVLSPNHQIIIANGNRVWNFDDDLAQVTIQKISKTNQPTPIFLLSNSDVNVSDNFNVTAQPVISQLANMQKFKLVPKGKDAMFASIQLSFMKNTLQAMELTDPLGHTTVITFSQVRVGGKIPPALFIFKLRPGIDVIDETK